MSRSQASAPIRALKPYPVDRYASIDLNRLTVYAIYVLDRMDVPATFENIGVADFRMFPRRFAMVGFPEYPDVSRVNRALLQLRPKYRNWATGKAKLGWQLTVGGEEEAKDLLRKLGENATVGLNISPAAVEAEPSGKVRRTVHVEDTTKRIRASAIFLKVKLGQWKDVDALEVYDILDAYTHTPAAALKHRLKRLKDTADGAGDKEVVSFLEEIGQRFAPMFERR